MHKLRKPTEALRATVDKQAKCIAYSEGSDVDPSSVRKIQLFLPSNVQVFISIDAPSPRDIALTRTYMMVPLPFQSSTPIVFKILANQEVNLVAADQMALVGVIIEYLE